MASPEHEDIVTLLQDFFKVPNGGIIFDPPIVVTGQPRKCYSSLPLVIEFSIFLQSFHIVHHEPGGTGVEVAPDVAVCPDTAIIHRPSTSTIIPRPPSDVDVC